MILLYSLIIYRMRKHYKILLGLAYVSMSITACKLDPPILPGDPGYVASTPIGNTGTTGATGTTGTTGSTGSTGTTGATGVTQSNLTGTWTCATTTPVVLGPDNTPISTPIQSPTNLMTGAVFNNTDKSCTVTTVLASVTDNTYVLSTVGTNLYIQFPDELFQRSANDKIQITVLTSTAMTWLVIDPAVTTVGNGISARTGYIITFTK
jgi:hypothetical protein